MSARDEQGIDGLLREIGRGLPFEQRLVAAMGTVLAQCSPDRRVAQMMLGVVMIEACFRHPEWVQAVVSRTRASLPDDGYKGMVDLAEQLVRYAFIEAESDEEDDDDE